MKKSSEESQKTKERIIESALYTFLEKGYSQTSVEDIVTPLKLTRGAFYWHFKDKDDLFKSIMHMEQSQRVNAMNSIISENKDERKKLESIMINIIDNFYENERYRSFIKLRWFRIEHDPNKFALPITMQMNQTTESALFNTIESAKEKGMLVDNIVPFEIASHLIALINGIYRMYFVGPEFFLTKENPIKMVLDYIKLIFK